MQAIWRHFADYWFAWLVGGWVFLDCGGMGVRSWAEFECRNACTKAGSLYVESRISCECGSRALPKCPSEEARCAP